MQNTRKALTELVRKVGSQMELARRCGLERTRVHRDLSGGSGNIPDERFRKYLEACPEDWRGAFVAARIRDLVPPSLRDLVWDESGEQFALAETSGLSPGTAEALAWLAKECGEDSELEQMVLAMTRLAGRKG